MSVGFYQLSTQALQTPSVQDYSSTDIVLTKLSDECDIDDIRACDG